MATRLRTLLIAVVVIAAAYTAAAWAIGIDVQRQLESREQQALKNAPNIVLVKQEYRRGVYGAIEESTYALRGPIARLALAVPGGSGTAPTLQLTVRNIIHHGPLPELRSAALAVVDTDLIPSADLARKLNAIFGGRPIAAIHTSMGWFGGSTTDFSVPAFRTQLSAGATISSRGLSGTGAATRNLASWSGHAVWDGFALQSESPRAGVDLGGLSFDAKLRRVFDDVYVGDVHMKLASLDVRRASGAPFVMKDLSVTGTSAVNGEYVDAEQDATADEVSTAKFSLSHVVYAIRITHIQGAALASLTQAVRQARASAIPGYTTVSPAIQDALRQYGVELLIHDPVLELPRAGFSMPEGAFSLSAKLAEPGLRREDLMGGPANLLALMHHLEATVDLRIDAALLSKLLGSTPRGPVLSAQLQGLEKQGYLKQDGKAWVAQLAYHGGKLTINGQAYPPAPGP